MTELSSDYLLRFAGIGRLYGNAGLEKLAASHIMVIGIGGVGSWVAEALARSGIGKITLVDLDDICISNTNRQVHTLASTTGKMKVDVMAERLRGINPEITVNCIHDFIVKSNAESMVREVNPDIVIDAIDSVLAKVALLNFCQRNKFKVITIGSAGGKSDPRLITSGDLSRTVSDPLLAVVRRDLRRVHKFSRNPKRRFMIEAIYSTEQMVYPDGEGGVCQSKEGLDGSKLDCSGGFGAISMVTATFGMVAASRCVEKLLLK